MYCGDNRSSLSEMFYIIQAAYAVSEKTLLFLEKVTKKQWFGTRRLAGKVTLLRHLSLLKFKLVTSASGTLAPLSTAVPPNRCAVPC